MAAPIPVSFVGADTGSHRVVRMDTISGSPLASVVAVSAHSTHLASNAVPGATWVLRGTNVAVRYVTRTEQEALHAVQPTLGRAECQHAALIPIRKVEAWWELPQDERRAIFETRSQHIASCLKYLPAIARRLHHSRELGEPFDFLTWFEYAAEHVALFDDLVGLLRASEEWQYVDREIDIRLVKARA